MTVYQSPWIYYRKQDPGASTSRETGRLGVYVKILKKEKREKQRESEARDARVFMDRT